MWYEMAAGVCHTLDTKAYLIFHYCNFKNLQKLYAYIYFSW